MTRFRISFIAIMAAAAVLFFSTKSMQIRASREGDELAYAFTGMSVLLPCVSAGLMFAATFLIAAGKHGLLRLFGVLPAILGLMLCFVVHSMVTDRVIIGPNALILPARGFPFRSHERIAFSELEVVVLKTSPSTRQSRDSRSDNLEFVRKDRSDVVIPVGDLVTAAMEQICDALESHEVMFISVARPE